MANEEKLAKIRHSMAHVMAEAVLEIFPDAGIAIGPSIENGFYYDFELPRTLTEADLEDITERMKKIIKSDRKFVRSVVSRDEAKEIFKNQNFIFLDSKENDEDAASFTDELEKQLQQNGIRSKTVSLGSDEMAWLSALTRYKDNVIVPNSSSIKVLNTLFPKLKEIAKSYPEYRIKLLGYPEWQTYTNKHLENFYKFDTYAYSQFYRNPLQSQSSQFDQNYRNNFNQSPIASYPRFGMLGYDLTYYFLKGISAYGKGYGSS